MKQLARPDDTRLTRRFGIGRLAAWTTGASILMLALQLVWSPLANHAAAAGNSIYLTPTSGSYSVNSSFAVDVRANSNITPVNAILATVTYSGNLQFVSVSGEGSAYSIDAQHSGDGGTVVIARGSPQAVSSDQFVAKVTFKVLATGTGTLQVDGARSKLLDAVRNQNVAAEYGSGSYVLVPAADSGAATPVATTYPIPAPTPGAAPNVTIAPKSTAASPSPQPTLLPNKSEINIDKPSTIETTPSADKTVQKVQYYINKKLVITVNEPPYSYSVDTSNLRNGRYTLTTKTTYTDGTSDSVDSVLNVSNPLSAKQLGLQLRHYAWLILLLMIATGAFVYYRFFRLRDTFGDGYNDLDVNDMGLSNVPMPTPTNGDFQNTDPNNPQDPNNPNQPPSQYGPY